MKEVNLMATETWLTGGKKKLKKLFMKKQNVSSINTETTPKNVLICN